MKFSTHTQSLVYLGTLDCLQTPLLLNLFDGFLLFHQSISVGSRIIDEGYVTFPRACYLHASEILKSEWESAGNAYKERRIKYEREVARYLIEYRHPFLDD
jgi:hypothetical protein